MITHGLDELALIAGETEGTILAMQPLPGGGIQAMIQVRVGGKWLKVPGTMKIFAPGEMDKLVDLSLTKIRAHLVEERKKGNYRKSAEEKRDAGEKT